MKNSVKGGLRRAVSLLAVAAITALGANYLVVRPFTSTLINAAEARACLTVWRGVAVAEIEMNDPVCAHIVEAANVR